MKAEVVHQYGPPRVLHYEEVPMPSPAHDEVVVHVHAAGVGNWDALVREGKSGLKQTLPLVPGADLSGIVFLAGEAAGSFRPGEPVYGVTNPGFTGAYAEFAVCKISTLARKPATLSFLQAASVPVVAVAAWQMLFDYADVKAGQSVLIHGAAGNVGAYAVQLAAHAGANVIASASAKDAEFLETLGAGRIIDYRTQRFEDVLSDIDIVLDTVGGDTLHRSFGVVRRGGIVISVVSEPTPADAKRAGAHGVFFIATVTADRLDCLSRLIDAGILQTRVGETLELKDAPQAHEMLNGTPHKPGRIVLSVT